MRKRYRMMILHCPLGSRYKNEQDGATWRTDDVDVNLTKDLLQSHMKLSHLAEAATTAPTVLEAENWFDHHKRLKTVNG